MLLSILIHAHIRIQVKTFIEFQYYTVCFLTVRERLHLNVLQWLDSAGFGVATVADVTIAVILIVTLRRNRGMLKRCVSASVALEASCAHSESFVQNEHNA